MRQRALDHGAQQFVLVGVARRGHEEGGIGTLERAIEAGLGEQVEVHLTGAGGPAGGSAHGVAGVGEQAGNFAAHGPRGAKDECGGHANAPVQRRERRSRTQGSWRGSTGR
jgi:hypothetical protein